ncbi:MAG: hypothetical protein ACR2N4_11665 [Jatrophihabitans sp.]
MFDNLNPDGTALPADVLEPDWFDHPVYSASMSDLDRIRELKTMAPAARSTGELARIDARTLSPAAQVDLLTMLDEQSN